MHQQQVSRHALILVLKVVLVLNVVLKVVLVVNACPLGANFRFSFCSSIYRGLEYVLRAD